MNKKLGSLDNGYNICRKFLFFFWGGAHLQHMEVPRLGVESELQLPAYTTATATQDLSRVCDLYYSSQQRQILNPLSQARDQTPSLMVPSWICFPCASTGTPMPQISNLAAWSLWERSTCKKKKKKKKKRTQGDVNIIEGREEERV